MHECMQFLRDKRASSNAPANKVRIARLLVPEADREAFQSGGMIARDTFTSSLAVAFTQALASEWVPQLRRRKSKLGRCHLRVLTT